jgi:hypothetical protein
MIYPTPHLEKLNAALINDKVPHEDLPALHRCIEMHTEWVRRMNAVPEVNDEEGVGVEQVVHQLVALLQQYKFYVDIELVFGSADDFLYRQKGQLKLDNTIIEEFLPYLVTKTIPQLNNQYAIGPTCCYSGMYFESSLGNNPVGGGAQIRGKDQDFAIGKRLFIKTAYQPDLADGVVKSTYLGYITAECKTNLDKTMFQEATATAHDVKSSVPGAKYFLLCEWLDMTPISTAPTDIDEVLILRKARRTPANIRKNFSSAKGRLASRESYEAFLLSNPFDPDVFGRFINHIIGVLHDENPEEESVLVKGYF